MIHVHETKRPDPSELDPGIRALVEALWHEGHETSSSCQGGEGHGFAYPTVVVRGSTYSNYFDPHTSKMDSLADDVYAFGCRGFDVSLVRTYQGDECADVEDAYLRVEIWGKMP